MNGNENALRASTGLALIVTSQLQFHFLLTRRSMNRFVIRVGLEFSSAV